MKDMPNMNDVRARNMAFFGFISFSVRYYTPFACACQCGEFAEIRQNAPHAAFSLVLLRGMWYNGRDNARGKALRKYGLIVNRNSASGMPRLFAFSGDSYR